MNKPIPVPSVREAVSEAEWQLRVDLACAYRLVASFGWDDLIFTHLSVRIPGPEHHFLLNPYNRLYEEITASSLVKVDLHGNAVMAGSAPVNPAGFTIHSAIHMAREDANCVIHLHTKQGLAVSAMSEGLMPLTQTAMTVIADVAYHDYEGLAFDHEERERIVEDLGDKSAMILRNHGTLVIGSEISDAFLRTYNLEKACEAQVLALSAGRNGVSYPPQGAAEKVAVQVSHGMDIISRQLLWPALVRRMDRLDDSYKS
jgi:ribulose-5-phosphate 4-epimerase/fuculose-1-phosphate aldolase